MKSGNRVVLRTAKQQWKGSVQKGVLNTVHQTDQSGCKDLESSVFGFYVRNNESLTAWQPLLLNYIDVNISL